MWGKQFLIIYTFQILLNRKFYKFFLLLVTICLSSRLELGAQSITPYTMNNGGGYSNNIEWSISEYLSIANYTVPGYSLNTGVLQPMSNVVKSISEYGPIVFGNQISIGPNPTTNLLRIKANFNQVGSLTIQLLDANSTQIFKHDAGIIFSDYNKDILMNNYASGIFYVKMYYEPINGTAKKGIYKIIKL